MDPIKTQQFDEYPTLDALLFNHTPGYNYLLGMASNSTKFIEAGWVQVRNVAPFKVKHVTMLLFRQGEPLFGGNPQDCVPELYVDLDADKELNISHPKRIENNPKSTPEAKEAHNARA